ncbi:MAG: tRNA pseudouridine(38-40) synthase TruA [Clostridia bacterium]|nr:tRNA pseudouridine(38-40) synthase TruA [Clostridia bacterium]
MRYIAVISYFGANYVGWQRQLNGLSVQEVLEKALSKALGQDVQATASGRTDAGVHALAQVVHFDADTSVPTDKIPFAVNAYLPSDVSVLSCEVAPEGFHARFQAKRKTYCYKLYLSRHRRPILEQTHEHILVPLDFSAMRAAADEIEGEHDFKCFEATGSIIKNTVRTVYGVDISVSPLESIGEVISNNVDKNNECEGTGNVEAENVKTDCVRIDDEGKGGAMNAKLYDCIVEISVTGNGFLYNMVRIIAGTLVYAGMGKLSAADVRHAIVLGDRTLAGKTLPAKGLHLVRVVY